MKGHSQMPDYFEFEAKMILCWKTENLKNIFAIF